MLKKMMITLGALCFALLNLSVVYAVGPDDVLGKWKVGSKADDASEVTIYKCGEKFCGKLSKVKNPEALDKENPDDSLKSRKLLGIDMIFGFTYDDEEWENGKIYNPEDGKTYSCIMWFDDSDDLSVLNVKGYVGISLFGKTKIFYRSE
jgi:uncharacterized protein (DUF2147 family)